MRKLTYDICTNNGEFITNVATYSEMKKAKEYGYTVKEKMIDLHERLVYDCLKNNKVVKTVTTLMDRKTAKDNGYTIKPRVEIVAI